MSNYNETKHKTPHGPEEDCNSVGFHVTVVCFTYGTDETLRHILSMDKSEMGGYDNILCHKAQGNSELDNVTGQQVNLVLPVAVVKMTTCQTLPVN